MVSRQKAGRKSEVLNWAGMKNCREEMGGKGLCRVFVVFIKLTFIRV